MIAIGEFLKMMMKHFPNVSNDMNERLEDDFEGLDTIIIEEIIMPKVIELLKKDEDKKNWKKYLSILRMYVYIRMNI